MDIHLTAQQETRIAEAVERGIAAADRGEFVSSEEVWASVERLYDTAPKNGSTC